MTIEQLADTNDPNQALADYITQERKAAAIEAVREFIENMNVTYANLDLEDFDSEFEMRRAAKNAVWSEMFPGEDL
jgi:hypothetical protein